MFLSIAASRFNMFFRGAKVDDEASAHCLSLPRKGFGLPACSRGARDHSPAADFKIAHAAQTETSQRGEILTRSVSEEIGRGPRLLFGLTIVTNPANHWAHRGTEGSRNGHLAPPYEEGVAPSDSPQHDT